MIEHWESADLVIRVPVTFQDGATVTDLTAATATAKAQKAGSAAVTGAVEITGAAELVVSFAENALPAGDYTLQVTVKSGGETQVVAETVIRSNRSI